MSSTMTGAAGPAPKKKAIPSWYYLAGAGALAAAYMLWKRSSASSTAANAAAAAQTAASTAATTPVATGSYGSDLSGLGAYLQQLQGQQATTTGTTVTSWYGRV